ncbi:MAG: S1 RNA-binding domain-containing protein [Candidatus Pacebacteria bacterium]|nr:S1 RNA-binding domain-containing protein [Candidatus Paceibacterota bacterium]MBP9818944.1 S1 RNA-binding domain-containing protein [Candidatus Paceibacterota bacterium]
MTKTKDAAIPEISNEELELAPKNDSYMGKLLVDTITPPTIGDLVEGSVIAIDKKGVFIDLKPYGTGIIFGREYVNARDIIRKVNVGDSIAAKVVDMNNEDGYIELSLKEAKQALTWSEAETAIKARTVFDIPVLEANKGGLLLSWNGIHGFLPASQLKADHYPRVADGDKDRILEELKKFVGTKLSVTIIGASPKEGKLIFSEKNPETKDKERIIGKYAINDEAEGTVTGVVDFGVFIKLEEGLEGLVHISEINWALVEDPRALYKVGDKVKVKVIEIKDGKISLSIKALQPNPWKEAEKKYKKDDIVSGVVIKFNKHGALASIEEGVAGLVHVSEFGSDIKLKEKLELGKIYTFKINLFDAKEQKMALSFVDKK